MNRPRHAYVCFFALHIHAALPNIRPSRRRAAETGGVFWCGFWSVPAASQSRRQFPPCKQVSV